MSSFPYDAADGPFFPAPLQDFAAKRAVVLKHLARSERLAEVRPASRLEVRPRPEMLSTGIPQIDALSGGIPRGCMSEIYGPASSGKTSVLQAMLATATQRDESCVLIDACDSFDPESAQVAGVEFRKLLWIRCRNLSLRVSVPSVVKDFGNHPSTSLRAGFAAQRKIQSECRVEQVLKTTDLILQSGGFGLVALDLAGIPEKFVRRIPLASWFRFQRAVEHSQTALLVIAEFCCTESCASMILKCARQPSAFSRQPSGKPSHIQLLEKMSAEAELVRSRLERKPMQSVRANFETRAVLTG